MERAEGGLAVITQRSWSRNRVRGSSEHAWCFAAERAIRMGVTCAFRGNGVGVAFIAVLAYVHSTVL